LTEIGDFPKQMLSQHSFSNAWVLVSPRWYNNMDLLKMLGCYICHILEYLRLPHNLADVFCIPFSSSRKIPKWL